jgi:hypothetical protein
MTLPSILRLRQLPTTAIALEIAGSLVIAAAIWLDEIFDVPHYAFGAPVSPFRPHEAIWESSLVLVLGAVIVAVTVKLVRHLERVIVLCAWCRRAQLDSAWVSIEEFFLVHRAKTSHGMCPECALRFEAQQGGV